MGTGRFLAGALALAISSVPPEGQAGTSFVTPQLLLSYPSGTYVIDYRPAINAAGTQIVFERQVPGPKHEAYDYATLYYANLVDPSTLTPVPVKQSTRADWCWSSAQPDQIAFKSPVGIYKYTIPTAQSPNSLQPGIMEHPPQAIEAQAS